MIRQQNTYSMRTSPEMARSRDVNGFIFCMALKSLISRLHRAEPLMIDDAKKALWYGR